MECSMCGDIGFAEQLFQCSQCRFRFQHIYCSREYFFGDHIELCDWCFVESDQSGGSTDNFHSSTESKLNLTKNIDGRTSNAPNSHKRKGDEANAFSLKRKGVAVRLTVKCIDRKVNMAAELMTSVSKTKVRNTRLVPRRSRQRMKLLHEILC